MGLLAPACGGHAEGGRRTFRGGGLLCRRGLRVGRLMQGHRAEAAANLHDGGPRGVEVLTPVRPIRGKEGSISD